MTGTKETIIDALDFAKGMSSGINITDGGFSNETNAVNLTYEPGVINGVPDPTDKSTNMSGNGIAHCVSDGTGSYSNGFILTDNGTVLGVDVSQNLTASAALSGTYQVGTSDMTNFYPSGDASKIYITSTNDIARMNIDLSAGDATWWSVTLGKGALNTSVRHPVLQYLDYVYVGNGNVLVRIESSTSGTANHLVLPQQNQIVALGIDPNTGRMLISTTQGPNYSGTVSATNKVFVYDGRSAQVDKELPVDAMITAFKSQGGISYLGVGRKLGYWNGAGIGYLRTLKNAGLVSSQLIYKHHFANIENIMYLIDGTQALAYGEVLPGKKVFWYAFSNVTNSNNLDVIFNTGDGKLGMCFASAKFYTFDTIGTGAGQLNSLKTLRYNYARPIFVRQIAIEYGGDGIANEAVNARTLYYRIDSAPTSSVALSSITNSSGATVFKTDGIIGMPGPTRTVQLVYGGGTESGIRRIIIYYDDAY